MNRRKFLTFAAALLPCSLVAGLLGTTSRGKKIPTKPWPPPPNPAYKTVPYEAMLFSPVSGFHTEIKELGVRYDMEGNRLEPCFRATIRDCKTNRYAAIQSPAFLEGDTKVRRIALDCLYKNISQVTRRHQFPKDTIIYDFDGEKCVNPRYPDEAPV